MNQSADPSKEQWMELLEKGKAYRNLKPYRTIVELKKAGGQKENSLVIAVTPKDKETAYFTVMGGANLADLGFRMYIGDNGFNEMLAFFEGQNPENGLGTIYADLHFYSMALCSKEDLPWRYESLYKELGVRFRGNGNYIYFEKQNGRYLPLLLRKEEAETLLTYFSPFLETLQSYLGRKKSDLSYVIAQAHTYSCRQTANGGWTITEEAFPREKYEPEKPEYGNRDQKRFLKKQKHTGEIWEYDHYVLDDVVEDKEHQAAFFPGQILVIDHTNGRLIGEELTDPEAGPEYDGFYLANLIMEHGIPMKVRCADRIQKARLESLCKICGIQLEINPSDWMDQIKEQISDAAETSGFDELERVFRKAGLDINQLFDVDEGKEDSVLTEVNDRLEEAVRTGKITQEELSEAIELVLENIMYGDEDDWEDDWDDDDPDDDGDDWEDDPFDDDPEEDEDWDDEGDDSYYDEIELTSIKEKLTAIDIYYGKPVKDKQRTIPVPALKDYVPEMDIDWERTAKLSDTLPLVNQLLLKDMAEKIGGAAGPKRTQQDYIDTIIGFLKKKPSDIQKILTKDELRLYRYLDKVRMPEHYTPFIEAEMEAEQENLVGLVQKGMIDIGYFFDDTGICLELIVAHP